MADASPEMTRGEDDPVEPQHWHQYGMSSSISNAWLDSEPTSAYLKAFDDAWDVLVVRDEWRSWVRGYLIPPSPFLVLPSSGPGSTRRL